MHCPGFRDPRSPSIDRFLFSLEPSPFKISFEIYVWTSAETSLVYFSLFQILIVNNSADPLLLLLLRWRRRSNSSCSVNSRTVFRVRNSFGSSVVARACVCAGAVCIHLLILFNLLEIVEIVVIRAQIKTQKKTRKTRCHRRRRRSNYYIETTDYVVAYANNWPRPCLNRKANSVCLDYVPFHSYSFPFLSTFARTFTRRRWRRRRQTAATRLEIIFGSAFARILIHLNPRTV